MKALRSTAWPVGHLLNPATRYTPASRTDIRETFRRLAAEKWRAEIASPFDTQEKTHEPQRINR